MTVRATKAQDANAIMELLEESGQFDAAGLAFVRATLDGHLASSASPSIWLTAVDEKPVGIAYCAPEQVAAGTWNLLMLWMKQGSARKGLGSALVRQVLAEIRHRGARLLIVETSSLPAFAGSRAFYARTGFTEEARIRHFYADGDDKVIFSQSLRSEPL